MTRILGIDPGSQRTGIGIIEIDAGGRAQQHQRLVHGVHALIDEYQPQE
ncbi:crossover junction endodeoxyribonuclease RuvC, partial [Stenotrophomonas sp. MYb238]|nr:crossover junction endodeoxyribonuclease RuvC [Stenotrophomonas sp. MYb238]